MKKLLCTFLFAALLCSMLMLSALASDTTAHSYYDYDKNGTVELLDALKVLKDITDGTEEDVSLLRVLHVIQGAIASSKLAATITSVDLEAGIATVSTEYCENVTLPLSMLGLPEDAVAADYNGIPAVLSVHAPTTKFFDTYAGDGKGIYLVQPNTVFDGTPVNTVSKLYTIDELNKNAENGSHANDNYKSASLELNFREKVVLNSDTTTYFRYDNAFYPRTKKINDNLYLNLFMYSKLGKHLYYSTSADGINWNAPKVLWNGDTADKMTITDGNLAGTTVLSLAVNADACVLDDGTVFCIFAVRPSQGYSLYPDLSGLFMKIGTPTSDGDISWSDATKIYTGQVWEPSAMLRSDGQLQVYFTQVAPDITKYGYDEKHRSTETGLIVSNDNGKTWTPNIQAGDTNYYRATTVYREYVGDMLDQYTGKMRPHYSGQMPVATELYNGKILLAVEVRQSNLRYRVSYATSENNGAWKTLAENEEGSYTKLTEPPSSSPYVDRFTSGEIYLTYNSGSALVGRLGKPDGSAFGNTFTNAGDSVGIWGSCKVIDSHKAVTTMQDLVSTTTETAEDGTETEVKTYGINLYYHYLNHRINAKETSVILDGFINEWERNSDAIFVGSETQAQATVQVAHDRDNLYFLITRLDKCLTSKDTVSVHIAAGNASYYTVTVKTDGSYKITLTKNGATTDVYNGSTSAVKRFGTVDINTNVDQGLFIETAVPKAQIGLGGATSFKTTIGLVNKDASSTVTEDALTAVDMTSTANWINVVLD